MANAKKESRSCVLLRPRLHHRNLVLDLRGDNLEDLLQRELNRSHRGSCAIAVRAFLVGLLLLLLGLLVERRPPSPLHAASRPKSGRSVWKMAMAEGCVQSMRMAYALTMAMSSASLVNS